MICPDLSSARSPASTEAAASKAGLSMKLPLCSCDAINDSTSLRKFSSPEHASRMNGPLSSGRYISAELKICFTCCQRSGLIVIADFQLPIADFQTKLASNLDAEEMSKFPHSINNFDEIGNWKSAIGNL